MHYNRDEMLERLKKVSEESWGYYAFRRDPIRGRFTNEQKQVLIERALECGRAKARQIKSQYTFTTMYELANLLNIKVAYPDRPVGGGHIIFAQFVNPNEITIFKDSIDKAKDCETLNHLDVEQILLAHEIFHYVEEQDKEIFTRNEKIRLWKFGPFKNDSQIVCLSEIAGMAFAKELLSLDFSPFLLDVLLVGLYQEKVSDALYEEILEIDDEITGTTTEN